MKNIVRHKITNGRHLKELGVTKCCLAMENNQRKCGDHPHSFSMRADGDE